MLTLGTRLLAQVTAELGPLPSDAVDPLLNAVNGLKATNGARDPRSNSRQLS